jgi:ferric-dicitrate binding protein FerR (iron transport regulator)
MSAREEAARWFTVLRRGVMTLEQRASYERWLADETHRAALAEMQRVWDMFESHTRSIPPAARARESGRPTRRVMVAGMCIISLGILALSYVHTTFWTSLDWVTR